MSNFLEIINNLRFTRETFNSDLFWIRKHLKMVKFIVKINIYHISYLFNNNSNGFNI